MDALVMADDKGSYAPVQNDKSKVVIRKDPSRTLRWIIGGIIVSVALLIAEMWCLVSTVQSINNLQNADHQSTPPTSSSLRSPFQLPTVPCNKSLPCFVVEDDIYTKLVKLFNGAKRQTMIRTENRKNKSKSGLMTRQNCEQFSVSNCTGSHLDWRSDFGRINSESNGSVVISQNGTYGMYTIFTLKCPYGNSINKTEVTHRVNRQKHNDASEVLFERKIVLKPPNQAFRTSTFFEYVDLLKGDQVYPSLSDTSFLFRSPKANMWGVFLIR
ncbi:uncharacterized protein LOC110467361 isoform X2 [Mizuhopecten yessoensis]|uniref:TNF family profile domain-containing protein n=2 Tax=Mizuhopecten yessoensis TaxID=6573 RepID=A0A210R1I9_MIZYE|nr:uncharacterized protein LOC110467361 isoform X2 [Mizuhopecten yessoensis]OWF54836.1 hypothetical protein KP79_PYT20822 [Mizuhopecten yessoensis]